MNRREAIKQTALWVGSSILMPDILKAWSNPMIINQTFSITGIQEQTLIELCETIIPTTNTPGAKAANVHEFIKKMLADCYEKSVSDAFMAGLDRLDMSSKIQFKKSFADINSKQRIELVKAVETQAFEERENAKNDRIVTTKASVTSKIVPFFFLAKELTIVGYFTSEIGCTQALRYEPVPGRYDGALSYKRGDKAWAT